LKDFGRDAGSVSFADIDRDHPGQGILEYLSREDADPRIFVVGLSVLPMTIVVMVPTITVVMIDVKIATGTTAPGISDANVQDRLLAAQTMKIVDPGLHPPGGRKTKGLQGTMITGEEAMMTAKCLIIIMIVAGMTSNGEEMTRGAMTKKTDTKTEVQGMRMGRVVGPVE